MNKELDLQNPGVNADNEIVENYNKFISNFIMNAKNMDSETTMLINKNYLDLITK